MKYNIIHEPMLEEPKGSSGQTAADARKRDQELSGEHWVESGPSSTARERGAELMGTLPVAEKPQLVPKPLKTKPEQEPQETWQKAA